MKNNKFDPKKDWIWGTDWNTPEMPNVLEKQGHWADRYAYLDEGDKRKDSQKIGLIPASSVQSEPQRWVYDDWLPAGELTIVAGPPGAGKTTFLCALAAGVSLGRIFKLTPNTGSQLDTETDL
jgi:superfamily II DNA or RNA helicase